MDRLNELIRKNAGLTSELPDGQEKIHLSDSKVNIPENQNNRRLSNVSTPLPENANENKGHSRSIYAGRPEDSPREILDLSSGVLPDQNQSQLLDGSVDKPDNQNSGGSVSISERPKGDDYKSLVTINRVDNQNSGSKIEVPIKPTSEEYKSDLVDPKVANQNQSQLLDSSVDKPDNQNSGGNVLISERPKGNDYDSSVTIDRVDNQNQSELLNDSASKPANQNSGRPFNWNVRLPDNQSLDSETIEVERQSIDRPNSDVSINKRPNHEPSYSEDKANLPKNANEFTVSQDKELIPQNQNPTALGKVGDPVYKNLLGKIDDFGGFIQRAVGVDVFSMNPGQINTWIKTVTGGKGIEELSNTNLGNEAMLAYVRRILQAPNNLTRIAFDMAFRYQLLGKATDWILNKTLGISLSDLNKKPELRKDYVLGYEIDQGVLTSTYKKLTEVFFAPNQKYPNVAVLNPDGFNEEVMFTNRKRLEGFELADNFYWGLNITRYEGGNISSFLPEFPPEFSSGWWPVTTCSFSKGSLKSRNVRLPFLDFNIPATKERPSNFRMTVIDNATHSIRYWLEKYINSCFIIDTNQVLPYKNLLWNIIVYRYDCTMNTLYRKNILCLLSEFTSIFNGESSHGTDEIDLEFNVVGEIPGDGQDLVEIFDTNPDAKSGLKEETI